MAVRRKSFESVRGVFSDDPCVKPESYRRWKDNGYQSFGDLEFDGMGVPTVFTVRPLEHGARLAVASTAPGDGLYRWSMVTMFALHGLDCYEVEKPDGSTVMASQPHRETAKGGGMTMVSDKWMGDWRILDHHLEEIAKVTMAITEVSAPLSVPSDKQPGHTGESTKNGERTSLDATQ